MRRPKLLTCGLIVSLGGIYLAFSPVDFWPYVDPKLLFLPVGAVLVWLSGIRADRRLSIAAGTWVGVCALSAVFGADVRYSLVGTEQIGAGLVLFALCGYLLAVSAALPADTVRRIPHWLVNLGLATAGIALSMRLFGDLLGGAGSSLRENIPGVEQGSTLGHPLPMIATLAVSLAALLSLRSEMPQVRFFASLAVLSSGIGAAGQISSLIIPSVVLLAWIWKSRPDPRQILAITATVLLVVGTGFLVGRHSAAGVVAPAVQAGPTGAATQGTSASDLERLTVWHVGLRAFEKRPALGWGPANSGSGFLAAESADEAAKLVETRWGDMHNLFVELAVSTGILGLIAFLYLMTEVVPGAVKAPADLGWATGGLAAVGTMLLYEPILIPTLALLAILAGSSVSSKPTQVRDEPRSEFARAARVGSGAVLAVCLALSATSAASSAMVFWGVEHDSTSATRFAAALQPFRQQAQEYYAYQRILDSAKGEDPGGVAQAKLIIDGLVEQHPWDINVRLGASWTFAQAGDPGGASRLIEEHLARFPADRDYVMKVLNAGVPHL